MPIYMVLLRLFFASLGTALADNPIFMPAYLLIPQMGVCQELGRTASVGINSRSTVRPSFGATSG